MQRNDCDSHEPEAILRLMESRQKRIRHFDHVGHARFLTFSTADRAPLLNDEKVLQLCLEQLRVLRQSLRLRLHAYVFMPNHVHLLIIPPDDDPQVSRFLADFKRHTGFYGLKILRTHAPGLESLWLAGPGYDENITDSVIAVQKSNYIHNNPVRKGLATEPTEWRWSSARFWAGVPDFDLEMDPIL